MTRPPRSVAFVGVTGGAGTTRLAVETAAVLARAERDVAILDAAFATQGLAQYAPGRIDTDVTRLLTDDSVAPSDAFVDLPVAGDGRVAACPAHAPFAGLADAKTPEAAARFDEVVRETASAFDHVLVDTAPVAANQHVAAVTATDRIAYVAPATRRGADALPRCRDRLADLDATTIDDVVVANRASEAHPVEDATVTVPESDVTTDAEAPVCGGGTTGAFPTAVRDVAETAYDVDLDVAVEARSVSDRVLGR
jgi:septum site-determining protein MinD